MKISIRTQFCYKIRWMSFYRGNEMKISQNGRSLQTPPSQSGTDNISENKYLDLFWGRKWGLKSEWGVYFVSFILYSRAVWNTLYILIINRPIGPKLEATITEESAVHVLEVFQNWIVIVKALVLPNITEHTVVKHNYFELERLPPILLSCTPCCTS